MLNGYLSGFSFDGSKEIVDVEEHDPDLAEHTPNQIANNRGTRSNCDVIDAHSSRQRRGTKAKSGPNSKSNPAGGQGNKSEHVNELHKTRRNEPLKREISWHR